MCPWDFIGSLNDNFSTLGFVIIGVFALSWLGARLFGTEALVLGEHSVIFVCDHENRSFIANRAAQGESAARSGIEESL